MDVLRGIEQAYQGEVFGQAMYAVIADSQSDAEHSWKWRVLVQLEVETKSHLCTLLERLGGDTTEDQASRLQGIAEAQDYIHLSWLDLMKRFSEELDVDISTYSALEASAGFAGRDAEVLARLTYHEIVAKEFCDSELAGDSATSIDQVLAALTEPPPRP